MPGGIWLTGWPLSFTIEDLKKSETANTVIKTGSASVQVNQVNRLVIWVRGQQLDLWLNGTPLASVTIRPAPPSAADSTSATSFFIENWDRTADSDASNSGVDIWP